MKPGHCEDLGYTKSVGSKTVSAGETCGDLLFTLYDCAPGYDCADCQWYYRVSGEKCADACIYKPAGCDRDALAEAEHLSIGDCESQGYLDIVDTHDVAGDKWGCEEEAFEVYIQSP